jgi:GTP-binding protein
MFADRAKIYVRSGKGGDGHVSFRREKYVPDGGPDGGDGGTGGSVILKVDPGKNTLTDYRHVRKYCAENGEDGGKKNCRGKNGADIILKVPEGTVVKEFNTGKVIVDMSGDTREFVLLKGGRGGNGNQHYATSSMQAPKYAQPGQPAKELDLFLELKLIADVGLIGFPNVGKSTFLSRTTNARPEIANYHFTTINPHLGVVDLKDGEGFVMADIPGLIEGASEGAGLGHQFLRHIERTKMLIHVVDVASTEGRDTVEDIETINEELHKYNEGLASRPQVIAANKTDAIQTPEAVDIDENGELIYDKDHVDPIQRLKDIYEPQGIKVFPISAVSGEGLEELLYYVAGELKNIEAEPIIFSQEFDPEYEMVTSNEPYTVSFDEKHQEYVIEGPRIEKMLGYTNLDSEKGFAFFQKFLKENGILDELEALGIKEGDTVRMYGFAFNYYP